MDTKFHVPILTNKNTVPGLFLSFRSTSVNGYTIDVLYYIFIPFDSIFVQECQLPK